MIQKIATKIFMYASVTFGIVGIALVLTAWDDNGSSNSGMILCKLLFISVFTILPSFAVSVAAKYLTSK